MTPDYARLAQKVPVSVATPASQPAKSASRTSLTHLLFPSLGDFLFVALLALLFVTSSGGWQKLLGDGDTGWHIRNGYWILQNHRVPQTDHFSFSKPGQAWFAWEWLADVILAGAHAHQGMKGVVVVFGLLICLSLLILFRYMLWRGAGFGMALLLIILVADASQVHYLARPHVFTLLLLPVCLWILDAERQRRSRAVWLLVPIAALWVNLHGGFLVLFVALGAWAVGEFLRERWAGVQRPLLVSGACLLATLANPYGYRLHLHIAQFLSSDWFARNIAEYLPPELRSEGMHKFELLLFVGIALVFILFRKRKYEDGLLIAAWGHEALQSIRHVPIYMMTAAPIIGTEVAHFLKGLSAGSERGSLAGVLRDLNLEYTAKSRRGSVWVGVVALALWWWPAGPAWPHDFPDTFPVAMVNRNLAALAPENGPPPRLLSSDAWSGYIIYRLSPKTLVFMDGRFDFYGTDLGNDYICLMNGCGKWKETVEKWRFDKALLPGDWILGDFLRSQPEWRVVDQDKTAILLERCQAGPCQPD